MPSSSTSGTATSDARHVAGLLGGRPPEAGVARDVRQGERLAGREDVAGDALRRRDREPDDALALLAGRDAEHEPVGRRVVERDRGGLGLEQRDGRLDDRAQDRLAGRRLETPGGLDPQGDRRGGSRQRVRRLGSGSPRRLGRGWIGRAAAHRSTVRARRSRSGRRPDGPSRTGRGPRSARSARSRFTDWREPPIIAGQLGLGVRPGDARPRRSLRAPGARARRTSRDASRPGRSRKWSSSTWPVSRRSLRREAGEQGRPQPAVGVDEARGRRRGGGRASRSARARRRRRVRGAVEDRELAEEVAAGRGSR